MCVVMAAKGYPDAALRGVEAADRQVKIFHASTRRDGDRLVAAGGRVPGVTASGANLAQARERAYAAVDRIDWPEGVCRRDIGRRAIET